jgi:hypothetical protein
MSPHGIVTDAPTPPLSGRKVKDQLRIDVGGTHWIGVEEDHSGGGVGGADKIGVEEEVRGCDGQWDLMM